MPESKKRNKGTYKAPRTVAKPPTDNPRWLVPTMSTLFIAGVLWIIVYYISQGSLPVESIGRWNLAAGFGLLISGFVLTTRWK